MKYFYWLAFYIALSVASQFLSTTPIHLFTISDIPFWIPLSALTLVPLVDVCRSFTQDQAEREGRTFKVVGMQMMLLTFVVSGLCVMYAGLPLPVFVGVLLAVTFGGLADILVFRHMGKFFTSPVKRMAVSNAAATLLGSGIVFFVVFTDLVFPENALAMPTSHAVVGWLCQSFFIWCSSLVIAFGLNKLRK